MSDEQNTSDSKTLEELIAEEKKVAAFTQETKVKKAEMDNKRVKSQYERMLQAEKDKELLANSPLQGYTEGQVKWLQRKSEEYLEAAQEGLEFIGEMFRKSISFYRLNLITIGAMTGHGKSNAVANIA